MGKNQATAIFATRIKELLASKSISINELSRKTGLHRLSLTKYLNNEAEAPISAVAAIAKSFAIPADYLLGVEKYRCQRNAEAGLDLGLWDSNICALEQITQASLDAAAMAEKEDSKYDYDPTYYDSTYRDIVAYFNELILMTNLLLSCFLAHSEPDMVFFPQQLRQYLSFTVGQQAHDFAYAPLKAGLTGYDEKDAIATEKALIAREQQELMDSFKELLKEIQEKYREYLDFTYDGKEALDHGHGQQA